MPPTSQRRPDDNRHSYKPLGRSSSVVRPLNAVGPNLRRLRVARGWSQENFAAKLQVGGWDCSRSWLAKIEARQVLVRDHQLLHLSAALGVKVEELFPTLDPKRAMRPAATRGKQALG